MTRALLLTLCAIAATACSKHDDAPPPAPTPLAPAPAAATPRRFGDAMSEVGRRFERAGRAVVAGRWDFAAYDLGEIEEVFEGDLPHAPRPEDVPVDPGPMIEDFRTRVLPPLEHAAGAHDAAAFATAFATAAAACNACHKSAAKPFVQVPSTPGAAVPDLSPVP